MQDRPRAGTTAFVTRGVVHFLAIESPRLRVLILFTPAGMEGWFKEFGVAPPDHEVGGGS
ncbi:MAG: hypothetical protein ACRD5R_17930 [Candidatus Acidiferrales bacterium]